MAKKMEPKPFALEVGKSYRARDGSGPWKIEERLKNGSKHPFIARTKPDFRWTFRLDGQYGSNPGCSDLISLWEDKPEPEEKEKMENKGVIMAKGILIHQWGDHRLVLLVDGTYQFDNRTTDSLGNDRWNDCFRGIGMTENHISLCKGFLWFHFLSNKLEQRGVTCTHVFVSANG